jgi:acyl carrier protein
MADIPDEKLRDILTDKAREVFNQPNLVYSPDLVFRDILGFDSVVAVQYILAIEAALNVTLVDDEVDRMHTMGILLEMLKTKNPSIATA